MIPTPRPPVQIAWVTHDPVITESTLTALLGVRNWVRMPGLHHICIEAEAPESLAAMLNDAAELGAQVVARGVMPGGMHFAYVSAPKRVSPTWRSPTSRPRSDPSSTTSNRGSGADEHPDTGNHQRRCDRVAVR